MEALSAKNRRDKNRKCLSLSLSLPRDKNIKTVSLSLSLLTVNPRTDKNTKVCFCPSFWRDKNRNLCYASFWTDKNYIYTYIKCPCPSRSVTGERKSCVKLRTTNFLPLSVTSEKNQKRRLAENGKGGFDVIEFFLPMVPPTTTYQQRQIRVVNNKPLFFLPAKVKAARQKLKAHLAGHVPDHKLSGPLQMVTKWCFPCGKHENGSYHSQTPDTDNLQKMLKDVMTELKYWHDDCQVASEITEKFWAEKPGIYIKVINL